ncbi:MAG: hypothetical protein AAFX79_11620 [Planctomycetota bacterium]
MDTPIFPPLPSDAFVRKAVMNGVVDGDTIDVQIDVGWSLHMNERLRLESVNTPETRGDEREAGLFVKAWLEAELPTETPLVIASTVYDRTGRVRGKFGRTVAIVYRATDGWCLNEQLLTLKLAWPTDDSGSIIGERSMSLLTGVPEELRTPA